MAGSLVNVSQHYFSNPLVLCNDYRRKYRLSFWDQGRSSRGWPVLCVTGELG